MTPFLTLTRRSITERPVMSRLLAGAAVLSLLLLFQASPAYGQGSESPQTVFKPAISRLWINTYGNIQLTDRWFWVAQTHFRFKQNESMPFVGQFAQLYNRHALQYRVSKKLNISLGGVLRFNRNTNAPPQDGSRTTVPEWRIWHQYKFAMPFPRLMVYHRLRIEHRWNRGFSEGSEFTFRNRWRYMFNVKIPINKQKLTTGAFYISPEAELIMQNGKSVGGSPMEDLRLHTSFGYIVSPRLIVATGFMYSLGQERPVGIEYNQKATIRLHVYFSPDLRKAKKRFPPFQLLHFTD